MAAGHADDRKAPRDPFMIPRPPGHEIGNIRTKAPEPAPGGAVIPPPKDESMPDA